MKKLTSFTLFLIFTQLSFAQTKPQMGLWRGTFSVFEGNESPFNFELTAKDLILLNGKERFEIKNYKIKGDSIFVPIEIYDAVLAAKIIDKNKLEGSFYKLNTVTPYILIPFKAEFGKKYRFFEGSQQSSVSLNGKWDFQIGKSTSKTIGYFTQVGSKLTGTILSPTGDYRFLEGSVKGNEFFLSAFSGSGPTLIKGKVDGENLTAQLIGTRDIQEIKGIKNDKAELPDAFTLTTQKDDVPFEFTFPDAFTGKAVSLNDPKYKGKAVIVTIMGSWCPNCLDEAIFLSPWYKANKNRGVEIIGLSFERKNDPAFAKTRLEVLKKRFDNQYDILFAGLADAKSASQALPALSKVMSFPTTIFIDKNGKVSKIHTGFNGPATGKYYEEFIKEFNLDVDQLLNVPANPKL